MHSRFVVSLLDDRRSASLLDTVHSQLMFRPLIFTWHAGSGKDPSLAKASSLSVPLCIPSVALPPSSTSSSASVSPFTCGPPSPLPTNACASASDGAQTNDAVSSTVGAPARATTISSTTIGSCCRSTMPCCRRVPSSRSHDRLACERYRVDELKFQ